MAESQYDLFSDRVARILENSEYERLEFKEAKNRYDFDDLVKYCAAIANEGGGKILLGVANNRQVVGSQAFHDLSKLRAGLTHNIHLKVDAEAVQHPCGRVVIVTVPSRPLGMPIEYKGAFWMRSGDNLIPMTQDQLRKILDETGPDFSAEICPGSVFEDLDPAAIDAFRKAWAKKSGNPSLEQLTNSQLLADAELTVDGRPTYASLILLGKRPALSRYLGQSEVIFEYRASAASGPAQQRKEYRQAFLLYREDLWQAINARNEMQHFQHGLFIWDIPTFNEIALRESIANAISHRDYRLAGSVFIRQYSRMIEVVSPGGFPPGITEENCLWKQHPRNRRIAEALGKMGVVDRSGQGMNRIYETCVKESKAKPDFTGTDAYQVALTLRGDIQDPRFLVFLEKVAQTGVEFTTEDLLAIDSVFHDQEVPERVRSRMVPLADAGVLERVGRGRSQKFMPSRKFYKFMGTPGTYTRRRGLDKNTNKELLLKHLSGCHDEGCQLGELMQVVPFLSRQEVQSLLRELRKEDRVSSVGKTRGARWYPGQSAEAADSPGV